jgi:hypothetical protein
MIRLFYWWIKQLTRAYHVWLWNPFGITIGTCMFVIGLMQGAILQIFYPNWLFFLGFSWFVFGTAIFAHHQQTKNREIYTLAVINVMHRATPVSIFNMIFATSCLFGGVLSLILRFDIVDATGNFLGFVYLSTLYVPVVERQPPEPKRQLAMNEG